MLATPTGAACVLPTPPQDGAVAYRAISLSSSGPVARLVQVGGDAVGVDQPFPCDLGCPKLAAADEPLEFLVADGAPLFGQLDFDTSRTIVRLTDSIQALVTALGPRSYGLLTEIAQMSGTACLL